jgi:hypothetical protein
LKTDGGTRVQGIIQRNNERNLHQETTTINHLHIMKAISRIISVFCFAIGFVNANSADSRMNEVEDVKSNKVGRALQVYDEVATICELEGVALQLCTNMTQDCLYCVTGIIIQQSD